MKKLYQLYYNVPKTHLEITKAAIFEAGGGRFNNYDQCCFEYEGTGQFRPLQKSQPFLGEKGKIEKVKEIKVELIVQEIYLKDVLRALKKTHPYEEMAYGVTEILMLEDFD